MSKMLGKKGLSIIIVSVFAIISLIVVFSIFNVKGVDATFNLYDTSTERVEGLENTLNKYVGKNLLFVKTNDIVSEIEKDAYMQVTSIEKKYPNKISITVKERREVFTVNHNGKDYVLADNGFVLSEFTLPQADSGNCTRDIIEVSLDGINITELTVGKNIVTDADDMLYKAFNLAKEVNLTDCIDTLLIRKNIEQTDVVFNTYTKVKIVVPKIDIRGEEKTRVAFDLCDSEERDYIKTNNEIIVTILDSTNEIVVTWTKNGR